MRLIDMPNVIITPHNAFNTKEAFTRILDTTIGNIVGFANGTPTNLVKDGTVNIFMKIKSLTARQILDSRGKWTVEVALETKDGIRAVASVPQGKSTGSSEARALPAEQAVRNVNERIAPWMKRKDFKDQLSLDVFLCKLDGTPSKAKLGANAILAGFASLLRALWRCRKRCRFGNISAAMEYGSTDARSRRTTLRSSATFHQCGERRSCMPATISIFRNISSFRSAGRSRNRWMSA